MKSELEEILSGFEKRMKFINIVRRFLDYSLPDDIKETFDNNREKLNNIIIAVLLYIKEKTLGNNESCNMLIGNILYLSPLQNLILQTV